MLLGVYLYELDKHISTRNGDPVHLSDLGKTTLANEFEKFLEKEFALKNPMCKGIESSQVVQLLPALEWGLHAPSQKL